MRRPRMRPLFRLTLPLERERLMECIRAGLSKSDARVVGKVLRKHVELTVTPAAEHMWSPHLSLDLLPDDDGTLLRGRYAPHPHLWMLIMAIYGLMLLLSIAATVFGMSQLSLGQSPWALWGLPLCGTGVALTWIASAVGQRLAEPQMYLLQSFLEDCTRRASDPPTESNVEKLAAAVL